MKLVLIEVPPKSQAHYLVTQASTQRKPNKELDLPTRDETAIIKYETLTMCIIHKGFRGFRTVSSAFNLSCNLIGIKTTIHYKIIHSPLAAS